MIGPSRPRELQGNPVNYLTRAMRHLPRLLLVLLVASTAAATLHSASRSPERGKHGMVVSVSPIASRIGVDILKKGGNAADAAVAVGFVLAVT